MEWHQASRIKASMAYIEELLQELEDSLDGKKSIYRNIKNDLDKSQAEKARRIIRELREEVKVAKSRFRLKEDVFDLSHIMEVDSNFIWETIDDIWSKKLEKSSGKIDPAEKEMLDRILLSLHGKASEMRKLAASIRGRK